MPVPSWPDILRSGTSSADAGCAGDFGQGGAEGFDHQPPVVPDFGQGLEAFIPADVALARGRAIILGNVHVNDALAAGADGVGDSFFLDVRVERVVMQPEAGVV